MTIDDQIEEEKLRYNIKSCKNINLIIKRKLTSMDEEGEEILTSQVKKY